MHARSLSAICVLLALASHANATTYTWAGTSDSNWSTSGNWSPSGSPALGDSVIIDNAATSRTIYYDSAASGSIGSISINQTTTGTNALRVTRGGSGFSSSSLFLGNDLTLGGGNTSAVSQLWLDPSLGQTATTGSNIFLVLGSSGTGTVTLNAGGLLTLGAYDKGGTVNTTTVYGNIAISGGILNVPLITNPDSLNAGAVNIQITQGVTMSSGTLSLAGSANYMPRLWIGGNFVATGGYIYVPSYTSLIFKGVSNSISGSTTVNGNASIWLYNQTSGVSQSLSTSVAILNFTIRGEGALNNNRTISSTYAGADQFHTISFGVAAANGTTTLVLGSDISSQGGATAGYGAGVGKTVNYGIDLNGHALTFGGLNWAPNNVNGNSSVQWHIKNLNASSTGTLTASSFDFSSASQVNVGLDSTGQVILSATGNALNNLGLSTSGSISPNSVFRYVGATGTITSGRTIGSLAVGNGASTSTLSLASALSVGGNVEVKKNGNLDLAGQNLTQTAVSGGTSGGLTGLGNIYNNAAGTATLTVNTGNGSGVYAGTIADHTTGSGLVALTLTGGAGTQTLTGTNTYTGATTISSGNTLQLGNGTSDGVISDSSAITNDGALVYNIAGTQRYAGSIFGGGSVTKNGSGTQILAGSNTYTGATVVLAGELDVDGSLATASTVDVKTGATLGGTGTANGTVTVSGGTVNGKGLNLGATTFSDSSTLSGTVTASNITVASGTTKASGVATSSGNLAVSAGATLQNTGTTSANIVNVANTATLTNNGVLTGAVNVSGLLNGTGSVNGALTIKTDGELAPGNSPGITTVSGPLTVENGAKVSMQIEGTTAAGVDYDQIVVTGASSLVTLNTGSVLCLTLDAAFTSGAVTLIENESDQQIVGSFSAVVVGSGTYDVSSSNKFTYNGQDYELNYNVNADHGATANDLTLAAVPEPNTWAMFVGGIGTLVAFQRLRRKPRF